jgi:hypothetical protein
MTDKTLKRPRIAGSRHAASASVNGASFLPRLGSTAPSELNRSGGFPGAPARRHLGLVGARSQALDCSPLIRSEI